MPIDKNSFTAKISATALFFYFFFFVFFFILVLVLVLMEADLLIINYLIC